MDWERVSAGIDRVQAAKSSAALFKDMQSILPFLNIADIAYLANPPVGTDDDVASTSHYICVEGPLASSRSIQNVEKISHLIRQFSILCFSRPTFTPISLFNTETVLLSEAVSTLGLKNQREYYLFPAYGPCSQNAYFLFSLGTSNSNKPIVPLDILSLFLQTVHMRTLELDQTKAKPFVSMTSREYDVIMGLVRGKTNKDIARALNISTHTVNGYIRNIYLKLECNDKTSVVLKAIANNLV